MTPELNNRLTRLVHKNARGSLTILPSGICSITRTYTKPISTTDIGRRVAQCADLLKYHHPIFT